MLKKQELIAKIHQIQIKTKQLVEEVLAGAWHSSFKGRGMEFEEVREYQQGDDIRSIDWNVTARMNHPYVKTFKEERELIVNLIVDFSASLQFGTKDQLKKELIAEIGALLAFSAIKNNDRVGLILFSDRIEKYIPPKRGSRHVLRIVRDLLGFESKGIGTDLSTALHFTGGMLQKSSICFLLSDFLCDLPEHALSILAKKHDFIAIHVSDPCEINFPNLHRVQLADLESNDSSVINTSSALISSLLQKQTRERQEDVRRLMKKIGAGYIELKTNTPYLPEIKKFFKTRKNR